MCRQRVYRRALPQDSLGSRPVIWTYHCYPDANERRAQTGSITADLDLDRLRIEITVHLYQAVSLLFETSLIFSADGDHQEDLGDNEGKVLLADLITQLKTPGKKEIRHTDVLESAVDAYLRKLPAMWDIAKACKVPNDFTIGFVTPTDLDANLHAEPGATLKELDIQVHADEESDEIRRQKEHLHDTVLQRILHMNLDALEV